MKENKVKDNNLVFLLKYEKGIQNELTIDFNIAIVDVFGKERFKKRFGIPKTFKPGVDSGWLDLIDFDTLRVHAKELTQNSRLTVVCEVLNHF